MASIYYIVGKEEFDQASRFFRCRHSAPIVPSAPDLFPDAQTAYASARFRAPDFIVGDAHAISSMDYFWKHCETPLNRRAALVLAGNGIKELNGTKPVAVMSGDSARASVRAWLKLYLVDEKLNEMGAAKPFSADDFCKAFVQIKLPALSGRLCEQERAANLENGAHCLRPMTAIFSIDSVCAPR